MAEVVRGARTLQDELEKAKESLKDVDDNIRKLTGRDPTDLRPAVRRVSAVTDSRGRERLFMQARWGPDEGATPGARRRVAGGAGPFSRLGPSPRGFGRGRPRGQDSGDEDELPNKPTIQSSVVATPKEARTRKDSIEEQKKDQKGNARNRRMFGLLLGTLRKFKDEAKESREKEDQRKQIEQKLEEKAQIEKEDLQRERKQLFLERREKQAKIRRLEYKVELVDMHAAWERETKKLNNFLCTKAKPPIFYMPKSMNSTLENKLKETTKFVDEMIEERRDKIQLEIAELMSQPNLDDTVEDDGVDMMEGEKFSPDKENRGGRRRRSSGDDKSRRRSNEGRRNGDSRKRRKSESVGDDDKYSGAGKHRRRSKEEDKEGHRSGGRRDSHKSHRKDDRSKDRNEPRVEISYNDEEEEEEEGEVKGSSLDKRVVQTDEQKDAIENTKDTTQDKQHSHTEGLRTKTSLTDHTEDMNLKRSRAERAEDEEDGEEGEVQDIVDE